MTRLKSSMPSKLSLPRRGLLLGATAMIASSTLAAPLWALTANGARDKVSNLVDEVNAIIGSSKSEAGKIRDFEKLFVRYADVDFMARYALGVDGRGASSADLRAFTAAFKGYIARKYGGRFREFIGGRLELQGSRKMKSVYEVKTIAHLRGSAPFEVSFQLSDRSGKPLFVNMFIEGVNLLLTERTEIGAMLDQRGGSIAKLARDLK